MQTRLALKSVGVLDDRNARHVDTANRWLEEGNVGEACKEIRMIQRIFAAHPTVIRLRQRLVAVLCGWDEATARPEGSGIEELSENGREERQVA